VLDQAAATVRVAFVTAREPKLKRHLAAPRWLFRSGLRSIAHPGVIVDGHFHGSLMSGCLTGDGQIHGRHRMLPRDSVVAMGHRRRHLASGVTVTSIGGILVLFLGLMIHAREISAARWRC